MSTPEDMAATRAEPLPEERVAETGDEDRVAEASEILRDSEERVAEVLDGNAPGDAADQRRTSAETAD
jgi:exosome complex RNA-binding protein Csl4